MIDRLRFAVVLLLTVAIVSLPGAFAQLQGPPSGFAPGQKSNEVPVAGMGQHIIARNYLEVFCADPFPGGQPNITGKGSAALYFPYIAGIPEEELFLPGTDLTTGANETNAVLTAVFSRVEASQTKNATVTATFLKSHYIYYYYHPTAGANFNDLTSFMQGELVGVYQVQKNMFTQINDFSLVINSGPLVYSKDFKLRSGKVVNLASFMPGGITVHVLGHIAHPVIDPGTGIPVILNMSGINLPEGPKGTDSRPLTECAIMSPFAGSGTHPSPVPARGVGGNF